MIDAIDALKIEIAAHGMTPPDHIEPGKITRFSDNGGKNKNGWCCLFMNPDGSAGAVFGNWKDIKQKWFYRPDGESLSHEQQQDFIRQIEQAREKAEQERKVKQEKAAKKANEIWNNAQPADPNHKYLIKKQIDISGARQLGDNLLIAAYKAPGEIVSYQTIAPDGSKKFLTGGQIQGCYYPMGNPDSKIFYVCEGFATGSTIHKATGEAVIVAFNSGNLVCVSEKIKTLYPAKRIIIAADNDLETEKKTGTNPGRKAGEDAAHAIGAELCICPVNSDFNDLMVSQGIDALQQALKEIPDEWEPIIPLDAQEVDLMDPDTLPGIIGEYAEAVAQETETPVELSAGMLFIVLAACVQGRVKIQVKPGYSEPLAFWTFAPMPPATRKSQVVKRITSPLTDWERRQRADMEPFIQARRIDRENIQARIKALRGKYGKAERDELPGIADEIKELSDSIEPELVSPQIWAQDCTPENAGQIMARNEERLTILAAEGGVLDTLGGRYSAGVANLDLFLQGYSGDAVKVNRTTRDDIHLNNPTLSMGLMPQPQVIRGMAAKPEFKGRGFIGRPMYLVPESNLGSRTLDSEPIPDLVKIHYYQTIEKLLDIQPIKNPDGTTEPHTLGLSPEAFREWKDFYMTIEGDLADGGRFENCRDWAGKTPGRAARLAGLFHCAKNPENPWRVSVGLETMEQALDVTAVSISHALAVFNLMGADPAIESAGRVLQWIKRHRHKTFTKRQAFQDLKGTFNRAAMLDEPIKVLLERNHIRLMVETEKKPGRKSEAYEVNPALWGGGK